MRLIATCMAGNEADIVESFARHNARFLDVLVVLDHASGDATGEILGELAREGLPIVVLRDGDRAFRQGERQTELARRYLRELDADYCFALDADEFVKSPSRAALEESLSALAEGACGLVPLQNYFGTGDLDALDPARRLTWRMEVERTVSRKVVLPAGFAADASLHVSLGNHAAVRVRDGKVEAPPHRELSGVHLAHYPVRSAEQVRGKALLGWLSHRLTRPERFVGSSTAGAVPASHWRSLFEAIAHGELRDDGEAISRAVALYSGGDGEVFASDMVEDPLAIEHDLRFTTPEHGSALATLAGWADRLVSDVNSAAARAAAR